MTVFACVSCKEIFTVPLEVRNAVQYCPFCGESSTEKQSFGRLTTSGDS